jgi:DNA-directed RNA polymerase specialized sigma24 family protein
LAQNSPPRTSVTLLGRLRHDVADPEAWAEFVNRYGPLIYQWCRHWKLQEANAQIVLAKLAAKLPTFQHDPNQSFRAYVKTLARYAWCDVLVSRQHPGAGGSGDSVILDLLNSVEAREDL